MRSRTAESPRAAANPGGMIEVALGRISWILSRRTVVVLRVRIGDPDAVGPLGPGDAGKHLSVPGCHGVGGEIGLDDRARCRDAAIDVGRALGGDIREVRADQAALTSERVALGASRLVTAEDCPTPFRISASQVRHCDGRRRSRIGRDRRPGDLQAVALEAMFGRLTRRTVGCAQGQRNSPLARPRGQGQEERLAARFHGQLGNLAAIFSCGCSSELGVSERGLLDSTARFDPERHLARWQAHPGAQAQASRTREQGEPRLVRTRAAGKPTGRIEVQRWPPARPARTIGRIIAFAPDGFDPAEIVAGRSRRALAGHSVRREGGGRWPGRASARRRAVGRRRSAVSRPVWPRGPGDLGCLSRLRHKGSCVRSSPSLRPVRRAARRPRPPREVQSARPRQDAERRRVPQNRSPVPEP